MFQPGSDFGICRKSYWVTTVGVGRISRVWRGLHKRARVCLLSDDCVLECVGSSVTYAWVPPASPLTPRTKPHLFVRSAQTRGCLFVFARAGKTLAARSRLVCGGGGKCVRLTVNDVTVGPALLRVLTPGAKLFQMFLLGSQSWHHLSLRPLAPPPRPCPSNPSPKPSSSTLSFIMHLAS